MSEEEKVQSSTTGAPQAPAIDDSVAEVKKAKHWPIVVSVFAFLAIVVLVAFLHWHEMPTFCNVLCHQPMDRYVEGYLSGDESLSAVQHEENGVTCLGCHWPQAKMMDLVHEVIMWAGDGFTDPLQDRTEIASDAFCGKCHDGVTAPTKESATADWALDPHNYSTEVAAHTTAGADGGAIQCSDCHKVHKTSTLVCAKCHDGMVEVPEGWTTPETSVNVLANHSTSVSTDQCVTCHNDTTAASKETASAEAGYTLDFHNMSEELTTAHEGFVEGFGCSTCHENQSVATCAACHAGVFTEDNLPAGWEGAESTEEEAAADESADAADTEAAASDVTYADGTYEGTGKGIGGDVPVTVTVEGGVITAVEVGDNSETQGIGSKAIEQLPEQIVAANGIDGVDAVSGASVTSKAIFSAVTEALESAAA